MLSESVTARSSPKPRSLSCAGRVEGHLRRHKCSFHSSQHRKARRRLPTRAAALLRHVQSGASVPTPGHSTRQSAKQRAQPEGLRCSCPGGLVSRWGSLSGGRQASAPARPRNQPMTQRTAARQRAAAPRTTHANSPGSRRIREAQARTNGESACRGRRPHRRAQLQTALRQDKPTGKPRASPRGAWPCAAPPP